MTFLKCKKKYTAFLFSTTQVYIVNKAQQLHHAHYYYESDKHSNLSLDLHQSGGPLSNLQRNESKQYVLCCGGILQVVLDKTPKICQILNSVEIMSSLHNLHQNSNSIVSILYLNGTFLEDFNILCDYRRIFQTINNCCLKKLVKQLSLTEVVKKTPPLFWDPFWHRGECVRRPASNRLLFSTTIDEWSLNSRKLFCSNRSINVRFLYKSSVLAVCSE